MTGRGRGARTGRPTRAHRTLNIAAALAAVAVIVTVYTSPTGADQ